MTLRSRSLYALALLVTVLEASACTASSSGRSGRPDSGIVGESGLVDSSRGSPDGRTVSVPEASTARDTSLPDSSTTKEAGARDGAVEVDAHDAAGGGPYCATAASAVFCDDFTDPAKTQQQWTTSHDPTSSIAIGTTNPVTYHGGPTLHVALGGNAGFGWLKGTLPSALTTLYGRMRLYVAPLGSSSGFPNDHTDFFKANASNGDYGVAEQFKQISSISTPETGSVHFLYPGCTDGASQCSSEAWPSGQWYCLEWEFTDTYTDIYSSGGMGTNLSYWLYDPVAGKSDLLKDQYDSEYHYDLLNPFTSIQLGSELYGNDSSQGATFDIYFTYFAVGTSRFNDCASDQ